MDNKKELLNKIAGNIDEFDIKKGSSRKEGILKLASFALKSAANKQEELIEKIAQLEDENKKLKEAQMSREKEKRVDNLIKLMFDNSLIKKKEMESKKQYLLERTDNELSVLEENVKSIPKRNNRDSISDLTFLYNDNNIEGEEDNKENMAQALDRFMLKK